MYLNVLRRCLLVAAALGSDVVVVLMGRWPKSIASKGSDVGKCCYNVILVMRRRSLSDSCWSSPVCSERVGRRFNPPTQLGESSPLRGALPVISSHEYLFECLIVQRSC